MSPHRIHQATRFRVLATSAPVGIYEIDRDGECLFVNDHWCTLAGVEAEAALGRGWVDVIHPDDLGRVVHEWTESSDEEREFALEYRYRHPDGEEVWVAGRAVAMRDEGGEVISYLGTVIEITARKRAEAELEASEQRYRSTIESVGDVVFRTDPDGRWTFLNAAWTANTGFPVSESLGRHFADSVVEDDREPLLSAMGALVRGEQEAVAHAFRYRTADGEIRWAHASVRRIDGAGGEISGYAGTLTDITERRAAEDSVRKLAAIVDSSADAIISNDLDGIVGSWNPGAERVYGYSAEEMIGRSIEVLVPPGHQSELAEILDRVRAGERIEGLEAPRMRKDWRRIDVAMTISPIHDEHGKVIGASTIARDISEQKVAELQLAETARHFELSHELVCTCGFDGYFKRINGAWETTLGWKPEDLLPNPFIEIVHPDDRAAVADELAKLAQGGLMVEFRVRLATKGGDWRWTEWSASPELDTGLFYCSGRDVTDRVAAERALERERRQLADAQQIADVGSWEVDLSTGERTWSAQQYRNFGFDPEQPAPSYEQVLERVHPDDVETMRATTDRIQSREPFEFSFDFRILMPDGEVRALTVEGRPFADPNGSTRMMGTSRDITAERDAERLMDEFFGLISHELRTPLTSIIGYTELLAEIESENLSEQGQRFVEVIERNSRRELNLVGDLLLLTRITAGTFEIEPGSADLTAIAESAVESARPAAEKAGIELSVESPESQLIAGDRHRLAQVLDNLISNAIKFTPDGGRVTARIATVGDSVAIEVSDTGIGIAEDDRERLFERMFRAQEAAKRHIQGTGLGLTIVKAIVDAHGGTVGVESEVGKGTTFRIELPALGPPADGGDG